MRLRSFQIVKHPKKLVKRIYHKSRPLKNPKRGRKTLRTNLKRVKAKKYQVIKIWHKITVQ